MLWLRFSTSRNTEYSVIMVRGSWESFGEEAACDAGLKGMDEFSRGTLAPVLVLTDLVERLLHSLFFIFYYCPAYFVIYLPTQLLAYFLGSSLG